MIGGDISIKKLGEGIFRERKILNELNSLFNHSKKTSSEHEKKMVSSQMIELTNELKKTSQQVIGSVEKIGLFKQLRPALNPQTAPEILPVQKIPEKIYPEIPAQQIPAEKIKPHKKRKKMEVGALEKLTLKRIKKKKEKVVKKKVKKPKRYAQLSSKLFHKRSTSMLDKGKFDKLKRDLVRSNMKFVPKNYVSLILFTTLLSVIVAFFVMIFFLFFNIVASPPFLTAVEENIGLRLLKVFWIMILIPGLTFLFVYYYPSLERKSLETKINGELPFAALHMSSISGSMIEPSKIFKIIISTKEYPNLEKEFTKLQNEINVYGYDLVTAMRNRAFNSPSTKLSELFNGLATTITSGGNIPDFFEKRSETLLFDHRLEQEKQTKASETFMDIYISVVIAAPMILMLLLMMMRISGLGISLSTTMITLVMVLGVSLLNILFLTFLHLKKSGGK